MSDPGGRDAPSPAPLVTMTFWGVRPRHVPFALGRMALDRSPVRRTPGLRFAKLLGTGDGRTFTVRDADPGHWGLLAVWDDPAAADAFAAGPVTRRWDDRAHERLDVRMAPVTSRGTWSGHRPFGDPAPRPVAGPVAAITRARLRAGRARRFWRSVPPVSADLRRSPGLRLAVGIGEAPVGLQGTFSLWRSTDDLVAFAHRGAVHADVVRRTPAERWYVEELFARFETLSVVGTFGGRSPSEVA